MTRALAMLLSSMVVAAGVDAPVETAAETVEPRAASPWIYNTRGRTDSGIELQQQGELAEAGTAFGTALSLAPNDPLLQFNAGTAGLLSADPSAIPLLQAAAQSAPRELQPDILYNLGNAHMATEQFPAAIEAYKETLRLAPENGAAKHNLELALRELQQQQQQQDDSEPEQEEEQQQQQQEQQQQDQQQEPQEEQQPQQDPGSPLPDFEDQPDMTAEQAAAILEAVENLEREQRRKQALEQLQRARGDRDW